MSKICAKCGVENADDATTCKACGEPFPAAPVTEPSPPPVQEAPPSKSTELYPRLKSLRRAFFFMFLGTILAIIPVVDIAGGIVLLVGVIMLILGFGKIAKTNLAHAKEYKSTRNWLLFMPIVSIGGTIVLIAFVYTIRFPALISMSTTNSTNYSHIISFVVSVATIATEILAGVAILAVLILAFYMIAYLKVVNALKYLSLDLSVSRLNKAGNYLLYSLIIYLITTIMIPVFLIVDFLIAITSIAKLATMISFTSPSVMQSTLSAFLKTLTSSSFILKLAMPYIVTIVIFVIVLIVALVLKVSSYRNAYKGIDSVLEVLE